MYWISEKQLSCERLCNRLLLKWMLWTEAASILTFEISIICLSVTDLCYVCSTTKLINLFRLYILLILLNTSHFSTNCKLKTILNIWTVQKQTEMFPFLITYFIVSVYSGVDSAYMSKFSFLWKYWWLTCLFPFVMTILS
jgi:hypothetical protein